MKKASSPALSRLVPILGLIGIILLAYGRLLLHPDLHTACPENDIWNLPVRWSVLSSLRGGQIPLWNPYLAFGFPWLAMWTTECFYPGTCLFTWLGLSAWNFSGIFHLFVFSLGIYRFLKNSNVRPFWAFFSASIALVNGCAYNHLGSNSPTDTMAWVPWLFLATQEMLDRKPWAKAKLVLFLALQIFAGYPQIIFYALAGCLAYSVFSKGWKTLPSFAMPLFGALLLTSCQWIPSAEYYLFNAARLPAVPSNPDFVLPLENLKTFFSFNALSQNGIPDYSLSPTFFYFNFYSSWIPLGLLLLGLVRFKSLKSRSRFFLLGFFLSVLWDFGLFAKGFHFLRIPFPGFLEPAKAWVLTDMLELLALGLLLGDLFLKPRVWKWAVLILTLGDLLYPVVTHPLEKNLLPGDSQLESEAQKIKSHLGSGRILVLADPKEYKALHEPPPIHEQVPLFKHFLPNSNLYSFLSLANFNGSTLPTWGAMDAQLYFQYGFPYEKGTLLDLLGVDLLLLTGSKISPRFEKMKSEDSWTLWKNPTSLGACFLFQGIPQIASRKEAFEAFASGAAHPLRNLFLDSKPLSQASLYPPPSRLSPQKTFPLPGNEKGWLVITQNAIPGWRAWVDGKPSPLYLVDGIFQGIPIDEGPKQTQISYEPASFRLGLFVSLLTLGGFGVGRFIRKRL